MLLPADAQASLTPARVLRPRSSAGRL